MLWNLNNFIIDEFQSKLSAESWEDIFEESDRNVIFNSFSNIDLKIFYARFTKRKLNSTYNTYNPWITRGINVSCHNRRILYVSNRGSNDTTPKL